MPMTAIHAIHHFQYSNPCGNNIIPARRQAYEPSFITTPASNMLAAVGAATWPVGAHVWNGHIPANTAKPTKMSGNAQRWNSGANLCCASVSRSNEVPPEAQNAASMPMNTKALPTKEYSTSFIAPYSLRVEPQIAMMKYLGMIASS